MLIGQAASNKASITLNGIEYSDTQAFVYVSTDTGILEVGVLDENDQDPDETFGPFTATDHIDTSSNYACSTNTADYEGNAVEGWYSFTVVNTATLTDDGVKLPISDQATVTVNCYIPLVEKDAAGDYNENHEWTIEKDFDATMTCSLVKP